MMKRIYSWAYGWSFTMKLHDEARCLWEQPAQNIAKRYSCYESGGGQSWPTCYITGRFVKEKQYASKE